RPHPRARSRSRSTGCRAVAGPRAGDAVTPNSTAAGASRRRGKEAHAHWQVLVVRAPGTRGGAVRTRGTTRAADRRAGLPQPVLARAVRRRVTRRVRPERLADRAAARAAARLLARLAGPAAREPRL